MIFRKFTCLCLCLLFVGGVGGVFLDWFSRIQTCFVIKTLDFFFFFLVFVIWVYFWTSVLVWSEQKHNTTLLIFQYWHVRIWLFSSRTLEPECAMNSDIRFKMSQLTDQNCSNALGCLCLWTTCAIRFSCGHTCWVVEWLQYRISKSSSARLVWKKKTLQLSAAKTTTRSKWAGLSSLA